MAKKLIIDTDIGTYYDDAFAVLLASRSPEIDLLGVTTVYGDTDLRARVAKKVLTVKGRKFSQRPTKISSIQMITRSISSFARSWRIPAR